MDRLVVGDDEGHHPALATFFSRVSLVAHSWYFSSFSLNALFESSVDVTFTSTTTFLQSPASRRSHTRSGFSLAPGTRPFPFHSSDRRCSVPTGIIPGAPHRLPVLPLLLMGDQSSQDEGIVNVHNTIVSCLDWISTLTFCSSSRCVLLCVEALYYCANMSIRRSSS